MAVIPAFHIALTDIREANIQANILELSRLNNESYGDPIDISHEDNHRPVILPI